MAAPALVAGALMVVFFWIGIVGQRDLIGSGCGVACLGMIAVMVFRFRLYSTHADHHARRSDGRPFSRVLARFNRRFANPVMRMVAGWLPPLAIVRHRGRRTGRAFATPVLAFGTTDALVIGVLYGDVSDWVRNVRVAGGAQVQRRGELRVYRHERLVSRDEGLRLVPALLRGPFRALGVRHFLVLTAMSAHHPPS